MATSPNAQREELRHAALEVLASRPGISLDLPAIRRRIEQPRLVDDPFTDGELRQALAVLIALGLVRLTYDPLGSTEHFQAEAAGVLHYERGGGQ
jgi:hypothetical protein